MLKAVQSLPIRAGLVKCALALALWATPVQAQECAPAPLARAIMEQQGAKLFARMLAGNTPVEIWALPDGSEFKMFVIKEGALCLIVGGTDLRIIAVPGQEN
jgi:hypothetical protein